MTRDTKYTVLEKFAVGVTILIRRRDFILRTAAHVNQAVFAVTRHGRVVVRFVSLVTLVTQSAQDASGPFVSDPR